MNRFARSVQVQPVPASRPVFRRADPIFAVALFDRQGNLLGSSLASSLPGDVAVPRGINLRVQDLRPYLDGSHRDWRARIFALVSALWLRVGSDRVRVGVYMESGPGRASLERLELDLTTMTAILESQMAPSAPAPSALAPPAPASSAPPAPATPATHMAPGAPGASVAYVSPPAPAQA